jgi:hypothetical protein
MALHWHNSVYSSRSVLRSVRDDKEAFSEKRLAIMVGAKKTALTLQLDHMTVCPP